MRIHFIDNKQDYIAFNCETLKFFEINHNTRLVIEDIIAGISKNTIINKHNITEDIFDNIENSINDTHIKEYEIKNSETLYKLTLNITNKCNMNCKYCYADGGQYNSEEGVMTKDIANQTFKTFLSKYKNIKIIQFFGGEPLMNIPMIKHTCDYFADLLKNNKIDFMPEFGVITNGTIYTEEMADLLNKFPISMTVSIDGCEDVHDSARIYNNGNGTWKSIIENIKKYKSKTNQPVAIESTFNAIHIKAGQSIVDVLDSIKETTGIQNVHIVPVSVDCNSPLKLDDRSPFVKSVHDIFEIKRTENKDFSYTFVSRIIQSLKQKETIRYLCGAGISIFSVSSKGDIYPCFILTDIEQYKMGNVYDNGVFESHKFLCIHNMLSNFSKFENSKCSNCFNNKVCYGCIGTNHFNTGNIFETPDEECEMYKNMTESVIIELSYLNNNK